MQQLPSAALQDRSDPEFLQPSTAVSQLKKVKRPRGRVWCPLWVAGVAWWPVGVWGQAVAFPMDSPLGLQPHDKWQSGVTEEGNTSQNVCNICLYAQLHVPSL